MSKPLALLLLLTACVDAPAQDRGGADAGAAAADDDELLPDGAHGVIRVDRAGREVELPFVARGGLAWVEDDFAVGPAYAHPNERSAHNSSVTPWANDTVPYCIMPLFLQPGDAKKIEDWLVDVQNVTPLTFEEHGCGDAALGSRYVDISLCPSCGSSSTISAENHDGFSIRLTDISERHVKHEMGHALGFMHEQRRADRDAWVNYYPQCLKDGSDGSQFEVSFDPGTLAFTPYDYDSIMHYQSNDLSRIDDQTYNLDCTGPGNTNCKGLTGTGCPVLLRRDRFPTNIWATWLPSVFFGEWITKHSTWSLEDINGAYQIYEPALGANEAWDQLGYTMASGDFDGDGYTDLAVAAIGEAPFGGTTYAGTVYLYKGTMNGLVAWKVLTEDDFHEPAQSGDDFGAALAAADMDDDGDDELFVGAPYHGSPRGGAVFAYQGGQGGPVAQVVLRQSSIPYETVDASDQFGAALAIGEFQGGDKKDRMLAVGAPGQPRGGVARGEVDVFSWSSSGLTYAYALGPASPANGDQFGAALTDIDLDGDGVRDLIVGAPQTGSGPGKVVPFTGVTSGWPVRGPAIVSITPNAQFGAALGAGTAANGTAFVVVGEPGSGGGKASQYGWSNGALVFQGNLYEEQLGVTSRTGDRFGAHIVVGDLDGDGTSSGGTVDDIAIAAPGRMVGGMVAAGSVFLFNSHLADKVMEPSTPGTGENYGASIAIGNFDKGAQSVLGNSERDLVIGIPQRTADGAIHAGKFHVYRGRTQTSWRMIDQSTHAGP